MTVYLVGAGPRRRRADHGPLELLRACDVVIHDRLVAPELVGEAPAAAAARRRRPR